MSNTNTEVVKDKTLSHNFKLTLYLFLRVLLVSLLSFMATPLTLSAPLFLNPILGILYLFALLYFFSYTCHFEGMRDRNKVETGLIRENKAKGFLCSGILIAPMIAAGAIPTFIGTANLFNQIVSIVYYVMSMSVWNLVEIFAAGGENTVVRFAIYAAVYTVCFAASGIAYKLGYEDKHPLKPITDKFSSWKNA